MEQNFKSDEELGNYLKAKGRHLCLWINPYVIIGGKLFQKVKEFLLKNNKGEIAEVINLDNNPKRPRRGMFDFSNSNAFELYVNLVEDLVKRSNADAVMADFGETVPLDAIDYDGESGIAIRNKIVDRYIEASYLGVKRATGNGIIWGRSGSIRAHKYPVLWGGDSISTWEGMRTL